MADLEYDYEGPTEEPRNDFDLIPAGKYLAQICDSEVKETSSGSGKMLSLQWEIMEGPHERRRVFQSINYLNRSSAAQEIGQKQLGQITWALGIKRLRDTQELHFKPALITVKIGKADPQYGARNEISFVAAATGGSPAQSHDQTTRQQRTTANSNNGGRPWPGRR
jgi:hypothetical protein